MATTTYISLDDLLYYHAGLKKLFATIGTSLADYGITDAMTATEVATAISNAIANKADAATTLAGYGITDAMTATEIEAAINEAIEALDTGVTSVNTKTGAVTLTGTDIALSSTDTTTITSKINAIVTAGGEPNVIETVKVNGSALGITDKAVDLIVSEGTANGAILVNGSNVAVHGLGTAAYTASTAYDAAGAASEVLGASTDDSTANTVYGAKAAAAAAQSDVDALETLVGTTSVSAQVTAAIEDLDSSTAASTNTALSGITITDGKITAKTEITIPTNNNQLTNGAGYQTASDVSTAISGKADSATTLSGYGIADAYTKDEVDDAIAAAQTGAATYKGTVNAQTDISNLSDYNTGWYWAVATAGTYMGETCEVGDMIFCNTDRDGAFSADNFDILQSNIDPSTYVKTTDLVEATDAEIDTILAS